MDLNAETWVIYITRILCTCCVCDLKLSNLISNLMINNFVKVVSSVVVENNTILVSGNVSNLVAYVMI